MRSFAEAAQVRGQPLWFATRAPAAIRQTVMAVLMLSVLVSASETLPYIPTTILVPGTNPAVSPNGIRNSSVAYIISPSGQSADLLALDISAGLKAGSLTPRTLTSGLPFADGTTKKAFAPSISDDGHHQSSPGNVLPLALLSFGPMHHRRTPLLIAQSNGRSIRQHRVPAAPPMGRLRHTSSAVVSVFRLRSTLLFHSRLPTYTGACVHGQSMTGSTQQSGAVYSRRMLKVSPASSGAGGPSLWPSHPVTLRTPLPRPDSPSLRLPLLSRTDPA